MKKKRPDVIQTEEWKKKWRVKAIKRRKTFGDLVRRRQREVVARVGAGGIGHGRSVTVAEKTLVRVFLVLPFLIA